MPTDPIAATSSAPATGDPAAAALAAVLDAESIAALDRLADGSRSSSLVIVEAPGDDVAVAAGTHVARRVVADADTRTVDVRVAAPGGDRWQVAEVDEQIVAPARLVPIERTVIVVAAAAAMTRSTAEHLLKTVEEPSGRALFVFCVTDAATLLTTIRGRASATARVELAPATARIDALVATGVDRADAVEAVTLAGANATFAAGLAGDRTALDALRTVAAAPLRVDHPTTAAVHLAAAIDQVAAAGAGRAAGKAAARTVTRTVIARWRNEERARIPAISTPAEYRDVRKALEALDAAEWELAGFAPVKVVLAALLSRVTLRRIRRPGDDLRP